MTPNLQTITAFSSVEQPKVVLPNVRYRVDAEVLLPHIAAETVHTAFLDPQYRGIMDKLNYGNEGERQKERALLPQMTDEQITRIIAGIEKTLRPSGHLFLWIDKFHLCEGTGHWFEDLPLEIVDLITWDKGRIGMGYRTRRKSEYLLVLQKLPKRAKDIWTVKNIPDVWGEKLPRSGGHAHSKPPELTEQLILATVPEGGVVLDPAAGSFVACAMAEKNKRQFLGGDVVFGDTELT
jgi:site-specific DNA-methyltransferase (adenine-specific)